MNNSINKEVIKLRREYIDNTIETKSIILTLLPQLYKKYQYLSNKKINYDLLIDLNSNDDKYINKNLEILKNNIYKASLISFDSMENDDDDISLNKIITQINNDEVINNDENELEKVYESLEYDNDAYNEDNEKMNLFDSESIPLDEAPLTQEILNEDESSTSCEWLNNRNSLNLKGERISNSCDESYSDHYPEKNIELELKSYGSPKEVDENEIAPYLFEKEKVIDILLEDDFVNALNENLFNDSDDEFYINTKYKGETEIESVPIEDTPLFPVETLEENKSSESQKWIHRKNLSICINDINKVEVIPEDIDDESINNDKILECEMEDLSPDGKAVKSILKSTADEEIIYDELMNDNLNTEVNEKFVKNLEDEKYYINEIEEEKIYDEILKDNNYNEICEKENLSTKINPRRGIEFDISKVIKSNILFDDKNIKLCGICFDEDKCSKCNLLSIFS